MATLESTATEPIDCRSRALALWPGLDRQKLRRTGGDPARVARLVERRTRLPVEAIIGLLTGQTPAADHEETVTA